jgi:hypothetical protein
MTLTLLTLLVFLLAMLIMSVGVIFKRPCLRGSCGGPEVLDASGEPLSCATCPNRDKHRKEGKADDACERSAGESLLPVVD